MILSSHLFLASLPPTIKIAADCFPLISPPTVSAASIVFKILSAKGKLTFDSKLLAIVDQTLSVSIMLACTEKLLPSICPACLMHFDPV
ncbi:hypothetical protein ES707_16016 [subsurface metagenome]